LAGISAPYSGDHCATFGRAVFLISATAAGSATSLAFGNACSITASPK
jgi:hypothetical protein